MLYHSRQKRPAATNSGDNGVNLVVRGWIFPYFTPSPAPVAIP